MLPGTSKRGFLHALNDIAPGQTFWPDATEANRPVAFSQ